MKKYLSILLVLIMTALFIGCASEPEAQKGEYNIAYVTISFYNVWHSHTPDKLKQLQDYESFYWSDDTHTVCHITDWKYGKNNTIILYLKDGRTLQTATENVLLMYDPDVEK